MGDHCPVAQDMARDDLTREARLMYVIPKCTNSRGIASVEEDFECRDRCWFKISEKSPWLIMCG